MRWFSALILVVLISSCDTEQYDVGQFVYVDCFNSIHIDRTCASNLVENAKTKEERMANMQGVAFVDTCNLTTTNGTWSYKFCPKCIDDDAYTKICAIMKRNKIKPPAY